MKFLSHWFTAVPAKLQADFVDCRVDFLEMPFPLSFAESIEVAVVVPFAAVPV